MNTTVWCLEGTGGSRSVYALYGAMALWVSDTPGTQDNVWQYAPHDGRDGAIRYLVETTSFMEERNWILRGEPVQFDLSLEAIAEIRHDHIGDWYHAPWLRGELLAAVKSLWWESLKSSVILHSVAPRGASVGAVWYDTSANATSTWDGGSWIRMGTTTTTAGA
jgi:hypothetical protein